MREMEAKAKAMADRMAKLSMGSPTAATADVRAEEGMPPEPEPEPEPESEAVKPLTLFEARQVISQVDELHAQIEKAIAEEDFGLCAKLHAQMEQLAAKQVEADVLLNEATKA